MRKAPRALALPAHVGFRRLWPMTATVLVVFLAFLIVIYSTRINVEVSPDSVNYIHAARSLAAGDGLMMLGERGEPVPLTHFPPLYPIILSLPCLLDVDPLDCAKYLNAFLFAVNAALVMALTFRHTKHFMGALFAGLIFTTLKPLLKEHVIVCSEPLFIALTFLFMYFASDYLRSPRVWTSFAVGVFAGTAFLARYIGASAIAAGGVLCLLALGADLIKKWNHVLAYGIGASVGPLAWMARNALIARNLTNRKIVFHPPDFKQLFEAFQSGFTKLPVIGAFPALGYALIAVGAALLVFNVYLLLRKTSEGPSRLAQRCPLLLVILTTVVFYLFVLFFSVIYLDAQIPYAGRLLVPIIAFLIPGLVICYLRIDQAIKNAPSRRVISVFVAVLLLAGTTFSEAKQVHSWSQEGIRGYASATWKNSDAIRAWHNVKSHVPTYTNDIHVMYFLTGQYAYELPAIYNPNSNLQNPQYAEQCREMARQVMDGEAVILYFNDAATYRTFLMTEDELLRLLPNVATRLSDGILFASPACLRADM
jgi:hypothetical protein